jgi:hypothetical protein
MKSYSSFEKNKGAIAQMKSNERLLLKRRAMNSNEEV